MISLQVMMVKYFLVLFVHPIFIFTVGAQESNPTVQDALRNFEPSLAIVIGILSILFSLTFLLLIYAKFCHGPPAGAAGGSVHNGSLLEFQEGMMMRSRSQSSGVDKTVVESLPLFKFSSLKGSRDGLECAVCLSRFEDPEILRLLPKCKHAFHIGCIDQWLQKHSTCPLCRHKISSDDLASLQYSRSLRFLWSNRHQQPETTREDEQATTNLEVHIHRLESSRSWSSRFRKSAGIKKLNHRINIVSAEVVLKNRWSNVSSSDLMILTSEMILDSASSRFSSLGRNSIDRHSATAARVTAEPPEPVFAKKSNNETCPSSSSSSSGSRIVSKTMSEIVIHPRFRDFSLKNSNGSDLSSENDRNVKEERRRKAWLPIARRTVKWFASREGRQSINV